EQGTMEPAEHGRRVVLITNRCLQIVADSGKPSEDHAAAPSVPCKSLLIPRARATENRARPGLTPSRAGRGRWYRAMNAAATTLERAGERHGPFHPSPQGPAGEG